MVCPPQQVAEECRSQSYSTCNKLRCQRFSDSVMQAYNMFVFHAIIGSRPLIIMPHSGSGKTHVLALMAAKRSTHGVRGPFLLVCTCTTLLPSLTRSMRGLFLSTALSDNPPNLPVLAFASLIDSYGTQTFASTVGPSVGSHESCRFATQMFVPWAILASIRSS